MKDPLSFIINHYGEEHQISKLFEEMGELMIELSKWQCHRGNKNSIAEEIADVEILLTQLKSGMKICHKVNNIKTHKIQRQLKRIEEELKNG